MASPYILPEGNVQIAFSGGRTSAYLLRQVLDANGDLPDRVVVTFQNTGREMPEMLDFVHEVGSRWGVDIVWLEYLAEKPFFEVVSHNSAARDGEPFLIGRRGDRGKLKLGKSVRSVIEARRLQHSQKPEEAFTAAEKLLPGARRLELFSRTNRPGWTHWGDEVDTIPLAEVM